MTTKNQALAFLDQPWELLIDGELGSAADGSLLNTVSPIDNSLLASVPNAGEIDLDNAVKGAKSAQKLWATMSFLERRDHVARLGEVLRSNSEMLGALDSLENGNVYSHMQNDACGGAYMLDYFCGIAQELKGEATQLDNDVHYTRREPFGVVARLLPFNHPIQSLGSALAAPLLTGNTLILKPSPNTSLSALAFGRLIKDMLPPGVINILSGSNERVARDILHHPDIPRITVTGSTEVGKLALRAGAEHLKTISLELGGKTPMIVFEDADVDLAVDTALRGMNLKWQGHSCSSTSRVLIHRALHDVFVEKLESEFTKVVVGDPFDVHTGMGPISHEQQLNKVLNYIESGIADGAELRCGGKRLLDSDLELGNFIGPTIFSAVKPEMKIAREEIYGPVISVLPWDSEEEAISIANGVEYGLAAVIISNDLNRVHLTARQLDSGYVEVNGPVSFALGSPFGGFKSSGTGKEGNMEELMSFTQLKSINIQLQ